MNELGALNPSSASEDTLRTMLNRSLIAAPIAEGANGARVHEIDSQDPFWDDFLIRTKMDGNALQKALKNSSCLLTPEKIFQGFAASQPLLVLRDGQQVIRSLEIVPKHQGHSLLSAATEDGIPAKDILKQLLKDQPNQSAQARMDLFFAQVAFIATQENERGEIDIHSKNIMLHNGSLSLIDSFSPEDARNEIPRMPMQKQEAAKGAVHTLHKQLTDYFNTLAPAGELDAETNEIKELLEHAKTKALTSIDNISVTNQANKALGHPEWKGFADVQHVQLGLSTPLSGLKSQLAELHNQTGIAAR